jgi:hypothetical protein
MMHMVVFQRRAVSQPPDAQPLFHAAEKGAFATWSEDDRVHVLFAEEGEQNLRAALEI